jgi:hypothetical protein
MMSAKQLFSSARENGHSLNAREVWCAVYLNALLFYSSLLGSSGGYCIPFVKNSVVVQGRDEAESAELKVSHGLSLTALQQRLRIKIGALLDRVYGMRRWSDL